VGNYAILQGTLASVTANYTISFTGANFEITPAAPSVLTVTINIPSMSENGGSAIGTVTRVGTTGNLVVTLTSSDTTEATVPATVTILDGQTSATFAITAVDDAIVDGTQVVTITASALGFTSGSANINVTDDEVASTAFIIDNGDVGFSLQGAWQLNTRGGYEGDTHAASRNGNNTARWQFSGLPDGDYEVFVTWTRGTDRSTNAPYSVLDLNGDQLTSTRVNQRIDPTGELISGRRFQSIGVVTVVGGQITVQLSNQGIDGNNVIADAVRIVRMGDATVTGEIDVTEVVDGGQFSFGTAVQGGAVEQRTFTVRNVGLAPLTLNPISITGSGFTLVSPNFTVGQILAPGETVTFVVELSTAVAGSFSATVSFSHSDADENPYDFTITGEVLANAVPVANNDTVQTTGPVTINVLANDTDDSGLNSSSVKIVAGPANGGVVVNANGTVSYTPNAGFTGTDLFTYRVRDLNGVWSNVATVSIDVVFSLLIDNGGAGFSTTGSWQLSTGVTGFGGSVLAAGTRGVSTATWSFGGLTNGTYEIYSTWTPGSDRSTNAPYQFLDGSANIIGNANVSQRVAPVGQVQGGRPFQLIGTVTVVDGQLIVRLSNQGIDGKNVIADAIQIIRIGS
jgi:hypothetical protein